MDSHIRALIQHIHDTDGKAVIVTAGAGIQALAWILGVAGASRTLLDADIPYSYAAFDEFMGRPPEKYVSAETARLLAGAAIVRARHLREVQGDFDERVLGLSCTATIATDYVKRGDHRAHVAVWWREKLVGHSLKLAKGERDRDGEEDVVSRIMINTLAEAFGLDDRLPLPLLAEETLERFEADFGAAVDRLLAAESAFFGVTADGRIRTEGVNPQVLLPGSFNPLHKGHLGLAAAAAEILGQPVAFELSAYNVDKPPLERDVILRRIGQFAGDHPVYVTNAPTFLEKARLFPRTTFVVGYDTAVRIIAERYYGNSETRLLAALAEMRSLGSSFLVAGRASGSGFAEAATLAVPSGFEGMFRPIPSDQFRLDISSTEIRAQRAVVAAP